MLSGPAVSYLQSQGAPSPETMCGMVVANLGPLSYRTCLNAVADLIAAVTRSGVQVIQFPEGEPHLTLGSALEVGYTPLADGTPPPEEEPGVPSVGSILDRERGILSTHYAYSGSGIVLNTPSGYRYYSLCGTTVVETLRECVM